MVISVQIGYCVEYGLVFVKRHICQDPNGNYGERIKGLTESKLNRIQSEIERKNERGRDIERKIELCVTSSPQLMDIGISYVCLVIYKTYMTNALPIWENKKNNNHHHNINNNIFSQ